MYVSFSIVHTICTVAYRFTSSCIISYNIMLFCSILSSPLCLEVGFGYVWVSSFLGRCLADEDVASVTSTEMTENLVRAEVRRQLAERCGREALTGRIVLPPQSLPKMTDNESRTSVDVLPGRVLRNLPKSALFHLYSSLQVAQVLCARVIFGDCRTFAGALMLQLMMLWL